MADRGLIERNLRAAYAGRVNGDVHTTMKNFADDAVFRLHGRGTGIAALSDPVVGKPAITEAMGHFSANWRFDDWKENTFLVDGDKALLHWTAKVTFVPTGKSATLDAFDLVTFRDGQIVDFQQSVDTAMIAKLATP